MNDRLKIIILSLVAVAAVGLLIFFIQREASAANGGAMDTNDPAVRAKLKEHYEGMDRSKGPFSNMQGSGPSGQ